MNAYRIEHRFTEYPYGGLTATSTWFVSLLVWLIICVEGIDHVV